MLPFDDIVGLERVNGVAKKSVNSNELLTPTSNWKMQQVIYFVIYSVNLVLKFIDCKSQS